MNRFSRWLVLLALASPLTALAVANPQSAAPKVGTAPAASAEAAAELAGRLQKIDNLQADFTQVSQPTGAQAAARKPAQTVTGTLSARKPRLFRWEVKQPYQQLIVSDGKELRIHDPDLMQMTVRPLGDAWAQTPALLFSGDAKGLTKDFTVSRQREGGLDVFLLQPRAKDAVFARLILQFKGGEPFSMHLQDSLGQKTDINFFKVRVNASLPADLFRFTPPPGTDVVRE